MVSEGFLVFLTLNLVTWRVLTWLSTGGCLGGGKLEPEYRVWLGMSGC